eukprot:GHVN01061882.1.p1 GENE.GHVN01061882.1~~GHVN01061882.1.p1  ORF type:complete len:523 (-),score=72.02 GHVN01061882.1:61-1629(-)
MVDGPNEADSPTSRPLRAQGSVTFDASVPQTPGVPLVKKPKSRLVKASGSSPNYSSGLAKRYKKWLRSQLLLDSLRRLIYESGEEMTDTEIELDNSDYDVPFVYRTPTAWQRLQDDQVLLSIFLHRKEDCLLADLRRCQHPNAMAANKRLDIAIKKQKDKAVSIVSKESLKRIGESQLSWLADLEDIFEMFITSAVEMTRDTKTPTSRRRRISRRRLSDVDPPLIEEENGEGRHTESEETTTTEKPTGAEGQTGGGQPSYSAQFTKPESVEEAVTSTNVVSSSSGRSRVLASPCSTVQLKIWCEGMCDPHPLQEMHYEAEVLTNLQKLLELPRSQKKNAQPKIDNLNKVVNPPTGTTLTPAHVTPTSTGTQSGNTAAVSTPTVVETNSVSGTIGSGNESSSTTSEVMMKNDISELVSAYPESILLWNMSTFQRYLAHNLATYYSLRSHSKTTFPSRVLIVRLPSSNTMLKTVVQSLDTDKAGSEGSLKHVRFVDALRKRVEARFSSQRTGGCDSACVGDLRL